MELKIALLILVLGVSNALATPSYSQVAKVSLDMENKSLEQVMDEIERQSEFYFIFNQKQIDVNRVVNIQEEDKLITDILPELFKGTDVSYEILGKKILLTTDPLEKNLKTDETTTELQQIKISGMITDASTGEPMPGVNILVKGTTLGALADVNGKYTLSVSDPNSVIIFSFIGYNSLEIPLAGQMILDVRMVQSLETLEEVVVVGYNSQNRKDLTGSVSSITTKELNSVASPNLAQQLQGRSSGVTVIADNTPGGEPSVRIRGFGTINNNDPLYVIDGVPTKGGLNNINPHNIESLQILKDASAASIYGSRAANGVIIITTKKGSAGDSKLTFDTRYGVQRSKKNNNIDMILDPQKFGELRWTQLINANQLTNGNPVDPQYGNGPNPIVPDYILAGNKFGVFEGDPAAEPGLYNFSSDKMYQIVKANKAGTNWLDEIVTPLAPIQEYNLGASGGNDKGRYALGINYFDQAGLLRYTSFKRYSVRANTEFVIKKKLKIGENFEIGQSNNQGFFSGGGNNSDSNPVGNSYRMPSIVPVYDIMGNFAGTRASGLGSAQNPLAQLVRAKNNLSKISRVFGNLYASVDLLKNLTVRSSLGIDYAINEGVAYDLMNLEHAAPIGFNKLTNQMASGFTTTWSNTLNYKLNYNDLHDIQVLVGMEAIENTQKEFQASREKFASEDLNYMFLDAGTLSLNNSGTGYEWALFSLFGKLNYKYNNRYLFETTVRRDGSSRFGKNNRYGVFSAFSAGWRISEETFMESLKWIENLTLRGSWGQTGNQEIGNYNGFSTYRTSLSLSSYDMNGTNNSVLAGFDTQSFGNSDAKWETTTQTDIGLDVAILKGKIGLTIDLYNRITSNMLYQVQLPATQGVANLPFMNVGSMRNRGIDLRLTLHNSTMGGDLSYDISADFSAYRNNIIDLSGNKNEVLIAPELRSYSYARSMTGMPIYSFYGLIIDGIFQNDEEVQSHAPYSGYAEVVNGKTIGVGKFKYRDVNKDGIINDADRTWIGNPHPAFTYGLNINVDYKNFDMTVFFQGVQGNDILNFVRRLIDFNELGNNRSMKMLTQSWTPDNLNAVLPILDASDSRSLLPSSYFIEDGSYLRMKTLQIGYTLPSDFLSKIGFEQIRIYLQAQNLFTITNYSGLDPEVNFIGSGAVSQMGIDQGVYPASKIYEMGFNIVF